MTILTVSYMLSPGLAKSGVRAPYTADDDRQTSLIAHLFHGRSPAWWSAVSPGSRSSYATPRRE